jgi:hypothetical protein
VEGGSGVEAIWAAAHVAWAEADAGRPLMLDDAVRRLAIPR